MMSRKRKASREAYKAFQRKLRDKYGYTAIKEKHEKDDAKKAYVESLKGKPQ